MDTTDQQSILTLVRAGLTYREIERKLGIRRETIAKYAERAGLRSPWGGGTDSKPANSEGVPTGSRVENRPIEPGCSPDGGASALIASTAEPGVSVSACEPHRAWIEDQVGLKRNAMAIYQDLVDQHGFSHAYDSVKRFVGKLRGGDPERYDRLEFLPGEEGQVDYGQGAPTLHPNTGRYRKPRLFVMTLRYSRKAFRKTVWNSSKETWARLHEEAFRYFGGCPQYMVLDNLKEGVAEPDLYDPRLNPVYAAMLAHYGVVADPARIEDPDRKGTVENAIQHTQGTALKGRRFDSIEDQNTFLRHWEEKWAAPRLHGREKRQVLAMFEEEKPYLRPLPAGLFRCFRPEIRRVQDDGCIQIDSCFYFAHPKLIGLDVPVRVYTFEIEVLDPRTLEVARRHVRNSRPGAVSIAEEDRIFNPSRQTQYILKQARAIGEATYQVCSELFHEEGRVGQRRMRGIVALSRKHPAVLIEQACRSAIDRGIRRYRTIRLLVENASLTSSPTVDGLSQDHALIRPPSDYQSFWEHHAQIEDGPGNSAAAQPIQGELNLCP